jgi:GNAT superfamily N-acetyltransferase
VGPGVRPGPTPRGPPGDMLVGEYWRGGGTIGDHRDSNGLVWLDDISAVDWDELSELYRIAPLGEKLPDALRMVYANSRFRCFAYADGRLVAAGRALADGLDCAYIADVAVHPDVQGQGLGQAVVRRLVERTAGHRKVMLYAVPGTESFYSRLGFLPMATAMAIWDDPAKAIASGVLRESPGC